jgi:pimeloyl-ACP methyl ester carboxylesterase
MSERREEHHFNSGDGSCAAWLLRPHPVNSQPCPVVVMAHGFTATREDGLVAYAERFAELGIASLAFDYRGFGDSQGGERQVLNIKRELEDLDAAIAFARSLEGIDPGRVALWGSSFGGGMVMDTAARRDDIACVIAQVPFANGLATVGAIPIGTSLRLTAKGLADLRAHRSSRPRVMIPATGNPGEVAAMTSPDAVPGFESIVPAGSRHVNSVAAAVVLDTLAWRPGAKAGSIACPLLVQVGTEDAITPPQPAAKAAARAPKGELRRYACGHFDVYSGQWFEQVAADQVAFLERSLIRGEAGAGEGREAKVPEAAKASGS